MNAITQRNRTLGELMTELRARLGFTTQGSASKNNDTIIKSFLQEGHDFIYGELEPPTLRAKSTLRLEANSYLYDFHDDERDEPIDPERVLSVWLKWSDTIRTELKQGISEHQRSLDSIRTQPERYDHLDGMLELWPIPDQPYDLVIEHRREKGRFDRASDRPSVPDRLVFLYALANGKAHYRHPDAKSAASSFQAMLNKAKTRQHENRRHHAASMTDGERAPQVARTAGGYTLRT